MTAPNAKPRAGEHTKGPWSRVANVVDIPGHDLARQSLHLNTEANVRRIVACVNACEGVSLDALETVVIGGLVKSLLAERDALKALNGELVAFAESVQNWYENAGNQDPDHESVGSIELWSAARAILAKMR